MSAQLFISCDAFAALSVAPHRAAAPVGHGPASDDARTRANGRRTGSQAEGRTRVRPEDAA